MLMVEEEGKSQRGLAIALLSEGGGLRANSVLPEA